MEKTKILAANHIFVVGSILMLHMLNVFYILSVSYSLSVFDTGDYCSSLCNNILLLLTRRRYEIFLDNTFRISASPQNASIGPLSMQRDTLDMLCVIPASSSFLRKDFEVY